MAGFITKDDNGYALIEGDFATDSEGNPVDKDGNRLPVYTNDDALKAVFGDLWERAKPGIVEAAENLNG